MKTTLPTFSGPFRVRGLMPQGVNTPMLIQDGTGRLWVRKDVGASDMPAQGLLGELLGWFVGRQVGAPIPDAAIWRGHQSGIAWMSAYLDSVLAWDPALAGRYDLSDLGAILALDVVLLNRDRNAGNLLIEADLEHPMRVWAIDHERLGVAELDFLRRHQDDSLHEVSSFDLTKSQPRGLPLEAVKAAAMSAAERFAALDEAIVGEILTEALSSSGYVEGDTREWTSHLHRRCLNAAALVTRYLNASLNQ